MGMGFRGVLTKFLVVSVLLWPALVVAQFGGQNIETYQNRKVGAPPEAFQAAIDGDIVKIRRLWQLQRMEIFVRDQQQRTVLMMAVLHDHPKMVDFLLERQADVRAVDENGNTALHLAALRDHFDLIDVLLDYGAIIDAPNINGETPLMLAIRTESEQSVLTLLSAGANTQATDYSAKTVQDYVRGMNNRKLQRQLLQKIR